MTDTQIEQVVSMPIVNPETGGTSRSFVFMGVPDRIDAAKKRLIDWKGVANPDRFITQQRIGYQPEFYALALRDRGIIIREVEYRLVTRPSIRFCGKDANRQAYEDRCLEWLCERGRVVSHPYFLNDTKLDKACGHLWDCAKTILESRRTERWLPNAQACFAYERECPFLRLCEAVQTGADWQWVADEEYEVQPTSHPELKQHDAFKDKEVLTYSSLGDLATCGMYYMWKHERRYCRRGSQAGEALWVGSAMHLGMEVYADAGEEAALEAIDVWATGNPVLGEDEAHKQDQQIAKARAMVRAAALKWDDVHNKTTV